MAERPVFVPSATGSKLVDKVSISFQWHPGMAASQKQKNVAELHARAHEQGLSPVLEVSSKSEWKTGRALSAFELPIEIDGTKLSVECAFQGSKVFEHGGPYTDLYSVSSRDAKRDDRLRASGKLTGFSLFGRNFPLSPPTIFYDWLYLRALYGHRDWAVDRLSRFAGFSDIEFNPERSLNCQARSCALFLSLHCRSDLDSAMTSFDDFQRVASGVEI